MQTIMEKFAASGRDLSSIPAHACEKELMEGGCTMPTVNVNICPEIINWALSQTQEDKLGDKLMNNITKWLDGTKKPTFNQIEEFSKKANIPLGYFFLKTPPVEQSE